jgi:molecular chaperone HscA
VPAYFDDAARQATKDAARIAGLDVLRLINEPTAAALAYGLDSSAEGIYAVYDLGGGTFDVSILRLEKGVFQVLATAGHVALGGDDFDRAIAKAWNVKNMAEGTLLTLARNAKERLSDVEEAVCDAGKITRAALNLLVKPYIDETLHICANALEDAKLTVKDVKGVVLVGGSTRMLYVRREVERFFGRPPLADINPDEVVAIGAAIQADGLTQGSDNLLLDVVPLSLGLETMGGIVEKIIHRNTPIPVAVEQEFTTYKDGQNGMKIHVVQGEREMVDQNRSLARFELSGIPALPAGIARVNVRFAVDADGLLTVSASEKTTGMMQEVAVKPSYGLHEGDIEHMLLDSMKFAKEDIVERLLREVIMEAGRAVEELKSALASDGDLLNPKEMAVLEANMRLLAEDIATGDRDRIDIGRERLLTLAQPFAERRMDRAIRSALKGAHVDKIANG